MGKGTIISHTGEGLYSVTLNLDKTHLTAELAKLAIDITNYGIAITEITTQIATLEAELADLDPSTTEYKNKKKTYDTKIKVKKVFIINLAAAIKRQSFINANMPVDPTISAWCADLTTDLSGSVGTIEVPGERGSVNIQPGFNGNAVYNQTRDGKLQPGLASLENAVFYNYAILPGWQKWMPTYRYGTITAISGDNCDVTLEAAVSSVLDKNGNGLDINAVTTLSNVPIDYMDCDGEVFEVGDVVLIKFDSVKADIKNAGNWANCTVIGFKDHPKYPEGGTLLYTEAWDFDWNQKGFIALDLNLEPVLSLEPSITYPTASINTASATTETTRTVDTWGTPFLSYTQDNIPYSGKKTWTFGIYNVEHEDRTDTIEIDGTTVKTFDLVVSNNHYYRHCHIVTNMGDPEPSPTPPENYFTEYSALGGVGSVFTGTRCDMLSENAGWVNNNHYIYIREDRVYSGGTSTQYIQKTYLIINGVETLLYENDEALDNGYFYNRDGCVLTAFNEYSAGAAVFETDGSYKYIASVAFNSYDPELVYHPFLEIFYYDGVTLVRKVFEIDFNEGMLALLGNIDGTNIYTCGDITIK
jgi:hypothetical protein